MTKTVIADISYTEAGITFIKLRKIEKDKKMESKQELAIVASRAATPPMPLTYFVVFILTNVNQGLTFIQPD